MRRLHQAIVSVVAIASLLGFLVYKHEYDRLNNLLQVLNTFGQADCQFCQNSCLGSGSLSDPVNSMSGGWQSYGHAHIYSAFADTSDRTVRILGVVDTTTATDGDDIFGCHLWFESGPRTGVLIALTGIKPTNSLASFECSLPDAEQWPPYAVSLQSASLNAGADHLPVTYVRLRARPNATEVLRICAVLRSPSDTAGLVSQFLAFHSYVGVRHFTLYDSGIAPAVRQKIRQLQRKLGVAVELLPWNLPYRLNELSSSAVKRDCLARNSGVPFVLFAEANRVLVPKLHSHLTSLLKDESELAKHSLGRISLPERIFCTDAPDEPLFRLTDASSFPIFVKTSWMDTADANGTSLAEIVAPHAVDIFGGQMALKGGYGDRRISDDVAVVHAYVNCSRLAGRLDRTELRRDDLIGRRFHDLQLKY